MDFRLIISVLFLSGAVSVTAQQRQLKGQIVEPDSVSPMPFVYVISQQTGNGTMSDNDGNFSLVVSNDDTLFCSYVGYLKQRFAVSKLKEGKKGKVLLVMKPVPIDLAEISVSSFKIKPYEKLYMEDIIDRSRMRTINAVQSPITALYMQFSKEGKQVRKLARIFEQIFIEEQVSKKLNSDILAKLTGDDSINFEAFRKYCYYVDDEYIMNHEGVELYSKVMECYRRYKQEMR